MTGKRSAAVAAQDQSVRRFWYILGAWGLITVAGCGGLKLVPVSGTVKMGNQPLKGGAVSFIPDASKGNNARVSCVGRIDSQGRYTLTASAVKGSDSGKGAPLGWYKVTLITTLPGAPEITVDSRYLDPEKTPWTLEVVADPTPGAYDLNVTK
jgi:hypothetical protein